MTHDRTCSSDRRGLHLLWGSSRKKSSPAKVRGGVLAVALALTGVLATSSPAFAADGVIWDGGVETGGLPAGNITGGGTTSSQYLSILQDGGPGLTEIVTDRRRTPDSTRSLKVTMPAGSQREQPVSTHSWFPDAVWEAWMSGMASPCTTTRTGT